MPGGRLRYEDRRKRSELGASRRRRWLLALGFFGASFAITLALVLLGVLLSP